ncbi:MAG: hypothetical protein GY835_22850 [bacterium]|nr:hypothetical protein [bacterium]
MGAQLSLPWRAVGQDPGQRLWSQGTKALTPIDLLRLLLRGPSSTVLAEEVLAKGLAGLCHLDMNRLLQRGFDRGNASILLAAVELGLRLARARLPERQVLNRIGLVADYLHLRYGNPDQEVMGALFLDLQLGLLGEEVLYRGCLHRTVVEPRLIFKKALLCSASSVVVFHTHPSGNPAPSSEDLVFTRRLVAAGEWVGVRIVDHLILGHAGRWVSLQSRGAW